MVTPTSDAILETTPSSKFRPTEFDYWNDKQGPGPRLMGARTLTGEEVRNDKDEKLGEIKEIMLDVPTGRVAYAVMSVGGLFGLGDKLFAIPWSAFELDTEDKCFRVDADKELFKNAPGFDKDAWPTMADETWARSIHVYYGAIPYWE